VHPGASATKLFARQLEQAGRGLLAPVEWQHLPMRVSRQCSSAAQPAVGIVVTHEKGAVHAASRRLFCFRTGLSRKSWRERCRAVLTVEGLATRRARQAGRCGLAFRGACAW
jgi:hypothetical protein